MLEKVPKVCKSVRQLAYKGPYAYLCKALYDKVTSTKSGKDKTS